MNEINRSRLALWNHFLVVPHRELALPIKEFSEALLADPDFIGKAMFALTRPKFNKIRDLDQVGAAVLLTAPAEFQILRKTGAWCLKRLPPYQFIRVSDELDRQRNARKTGAAVIRTSSKGNRHMMRAMEEIFADFDRNTARREGAFMKHGVKKGFRRLFHRFHFNSHDYPALWAAMMDGGDPKQGILKELAGMDDPIAQAKLAVGKGLSDTVLSSVLVTHPATILVRIEGMTGTEALNARGWLEEDGWLSDPDILRVWSAKAATAEASSASLDFRKSVNRGTDERVQKVVAEAQAKAAQRETFGGDVLVIVDISGSMHQNENVKTAIMFCKRIASRCSGRVMVVACNESAREVKLTGNYDQDFYLLRADGGTSLGSGLAKALSANFIPERVVVCTDDGENREPLYSYYDDFAGSQHIFLLTGDYRGASVLASAKGWDVHRFQVKSDYAALDQVAKLMSMPPSKNIIDLILELDFPVSI